MLSFIKTFLLCFVFHFFWNISYAQDSLDIENDKAKVLKIKVSSVEWYRASFLVIDEFMQIERYDSAQLWLTKIAQNITNDDTLFNYYHHSRQAEIYYYNSLQRLGMSESKRALAIATLMNDSLLLTDAENFIGLFYMSMDSIDNAIFHFKKAIVSSKIISNNDRYFNITKPYHVFGNIAEAYAKIEKYDSAIYLNRISLHFAKAITKERALAVACLNQGDIFFKIGKVDSAEYYYNQTNLLSINASIRDVELLSYGKLALIKSSQQNKRDCIELLAKGFSFLNKHPYVNNFFEGMFLDHAIDIYKKYNNQVMLAFALNKKTASLQRQILNNNNQINTILDASLANETHVLQMQVNEQQQKNELVNSRLYLVLALLLLLVAAFLLYRYKLSQRLQLSQMRNTISQDLHDDVGSSLSSLRVYGSVVEQLIDKDVVKAKQVLQKINEESSRAMENIGDIVWSMRSEEKIDLIGRIKDHVSEVLGTASINYTLEVDNEIEGLINNITARKNVLLIIKEAINNALKYSDANNVIVQFKKQDKYILVCITDNGKGFDFTKKKDGNGLNNMKKRTLELGGSFEIKSEASSGTSISILLPITTISYSGKN